MFGHRPARRPLLVWSSLLLVVVLCTRPSLARSAASASIDPIADLIPTGTVVVEILRPDYSQEIEDIVVRMHAAARRDPAWFHGYLASWRSTPPWHPKLGVSEDEYLRYVQVSRRTPYSVQQRAKLNFQRQGSARRWVLSGWGLLAPLQGVVIDLEAARVTGRFGPMPWRGVSEAGASNDAPMEWRWFGEFVATHVVGDPQRGGRALQNSLTIGPLGDGAEIGMYWTVRRLGMGARFDDQFLLLRFAKPR